jgi:rhamnulokinase
VETLAPIIKPAVLSANYTNEGGAFGTTRVLKNIMGLWMIQECRRIWQREGLSFDYAGLAAMAEEAEPFLAFVDPDDALFLHPGDMPSRIRSRCLETGQPVPETPAQIARLVYECLALKYRWAVERLERDILGEPLDALYIVGGGSQNRLLNQMTANALKKPVVAGPGEATAIGNLLMQAVALGELSGPADIRAVVAASFETERFEPRSARAWDDAYGRFLQATGLPA